MLEFIARGFAIALFFLASGVYAEEHRMNVDDLAVPINDQAAVNQGGEVFSEKCAACHGGQAVGTGRAPCLSCGKFMFRGNTNSEIFETIYSGTPRTGSRGGKMGAFNTMLTNAEIINVVAYLRATERSRIAAGEIEDPAAANQDAMVFPD
ncbi:MAG: c-type cytochrome [Burkholderiales bacterium]|nr:c-type cytochrome [Burkholderiales bacterium]